MTDEKRIYLDAFGDEGGFADNLFNMFGDIIARQINGGKTVSVLFPLPCTLKTKDLKIPSKYIFAAATDKELRGKGYMSVLINRICSDNNCFYFLRPARPQLIDFYKKLGFKEIRCTGGSGLPYIEVCEKHRILAENIKDTGTFTLMYRYSKPVDFDGVYFEYSML